MQSSKALTILLLAHLTSITRTQWTICTRDCIVTFCWPICGNGDGADLPCTFGCHEDCRTGCERCKAGGNCPEDLKAFMRLAEEGNWSLPAAATPTTHLEGVWSLSSSLLCLVSICLSACLCLSAHFSIYLSESSLHVESRFVCVEMRARLRRWGHGNHSSWSFSQTWCMFTGRETIC